MASEYRIRDEFDVVFFRNVMIYFDRPTQDAVLRKICSHLGPGGFLFVGHSESLASLEMPLTAVAASTFRKPDSGRRER
jgi:chemotaxis protein methyltransferase CheR